jgi:hypothetical protein
LVEVILAIGIATAMLIVALVFYRQAADLRGQILQESDRCATVRLVLDRMAADLRTALPVPGSKHSFLGDTGSLSFTKSGLAGANAAGASGGLTRVSFTTVQSNEGTNWVVSGFDRREELLSAVRPAQVSGFGLTNLAAGGPDWDSTNRVTEPLTDLIRFAHFRYWDGAAWLEGWTNAAPPPGVEIILGTDPLPPEVTADEYPFEQFRRVIFLPAGIARRTPEAVGSEPLLTP